MVKGSYKLLKGSDVNQFTAIMTTHVVIENVMHCAIMTTHTSWSLFGKLYDMSIFKKELLWNGLRYLHGVKILKILIK